MTTQQPEIQLEKRPCWWIRLISAPIRVKEFSVFCITVTLLVALGVWLLPYYQHAFQNNSLDFLIEQSFFGPSILVCLLVRSLVYLLLILALQRLMYWYAEGCRYYQRMASDSKTAQRYAVRMHRVGMTLMLLMAVLTVFYCTAVVNLAPSKLQERKLSPQQVSAVSQITLSQSSTSILPVAVGNADVSPNIAAAKPQKSSSHNPPVACVVALWLIFVLPGLWWMLKTWLFLLATARSRTEYPAWWHTASSFASVSCYAGQWSVLNQLWEILARKLKEPGSAGETFALRGSWGTGKSFLLHQMEQGMAGALKMVEVYGYAEHEDRENTGSEFSITYDLKPVPQGLDKLPYVKVQVWSEETETDLQFAVLRGLLLHPAVLFNTAWRELMTPVLATQILVRRIKCWLGQLRVKTTAIEMDISLGVPLPWQTYLNKLASSNRHGFVVVLEEIDRATPAMAQVAIVMARRSLDMPGVTVIIPYVQEQIRYKVFNPLMCETTDLQTSMLADIWHDLLYYSDNEQNEEKRNLLQERISMPLFKIAGDEIKITTATFAEQTGAGVAVQHNLDGGKNKSGATNDDRPLRMDEGLSAWYLTRLQENGLMQYEQFSSRFEEKYLSRRINIEPISPKDIPLLLLTVPSLRVFIEKYHVKFDPAKMVQDCINSERQARRSVGPSPVNLRKFIGALEERLLKLEDIGGSTDDLMAAVPLEYYRIVRAAGKPEKANG